MFFSESLSLGLSINFFGETRTDEKMKMTSKYEKYQVTEDYKPQLPLGTILVNSFQLPVFSMDMFY